MRLGPVAIFCSMLLRVHSRRVLAIACQFFSIAATGAIASETGGNHPAGPVSFDINAQPLVSALDEYSAETGLQVVYDGAMASGRQAKAVRGTMAADAALRRLLDGTGLVVLYAAPGVFTLSKAVVPITKVRKFEDYLPYLGLVQTSIEKVFCNNPLTAPGAYRIKISFYVDPSGKVVQLQLLNSTNDNRRDRTIAALLQGLTLDRPPPDMPQPVLMAIAPRAPAETGDCGGAGATRRIAIP